MTSHYLLGKTLPLLLDLDILHPESLDLLVPLHVDHGQVTHSLLQLLDLRQSDVNVFT